MIYWNNQNRFELGELVVTANAYSQLTRAEIVAALGRHVSGDWGDVCNFDKQLNESSLIEGETLRSAYHTSKGVEFWIITEHDRSVTTVLLPEDY